MRLLTFQTDAGLRLGISTEEGVVDLSQCRSPYGDPALFFRDGLAALPALAAALLSPGELLDEGALELGPCVPSPGKILCVGLNYRQHAAESGLAEPATPVLFAKFSNSIAAPDEGVPLLPHAAQYDYEAELAVIVGRRTRNVPVEESLSCVLGYCNANDISARDLQRLTSQWLLGKTLDKFMPLGPYLVTADEISDPQALSIRCWMNGELRQDSTTADMIFSVAEIISYASRYMTLEPGDVISTGTPSGVILGRPDKVWLRPGDEVTVEVQGLGRLTNPMQNEA